jgi:hypothetical protein
MSCTAGASLPPDSGLSVMRQVSQSTLCTSQRAMSSRTKSTMHGARVGRRSFFGHLAA